MLLILPSDAEKSKSQFWGQPSLGVMAVAGSVGRERQLAHSTASAGHMTSVRAQACRRVLESFATWAAKLLACPASEALWALMPAV
jgi:hypothetical protein